VDDLVAVIEEFGDFGDLLEVRAVLDNGETIVTTVSDLQNENRAIFGGAPERVRKATFTFSTGHRVTVDFPGDDDG
jgi:hypothetical protein